MSLYMETTLTERKNQKFFSKNFWKSVLFLTRVTRQAEILLSILLKMRLSFSIQSKLGNYLFVAAAELHLHPVFLV